MPSTSSGSEEEAAIQSEAAVDHSNEMGFAKISLRRDDVYQEGIVDSNRKEVVPLLPNLLVNDITGRLALVQYGRKFLFVPLDQGPVSQEDLESVNGFQYAMPYSCGVALVVVDDVWFFINADGDKAFDGEFVFAESFHHDRALVKNGEQDQILDPKGNLVSELHYDQVSPQSPLCWQVTNIVNGEYLSGFVDLNGAEITGLIYDEVGYYDPEVNRIRVGQNDLYGFLDDRAQIAIPIEYEYAEVFHRGKARVTLRGRTFFISPEGNEVPE
jgi:hypothetical protein